MTNNLIKKTVLLSLLYLIVLACSSPPVQIIPTSLPLPSSTPIPNNNRFDFNDLTPHRQAMLPAFASDVDMIAATGASRYYLEVALEADSFKTEDGLRLTGMELVRYTNTENLPLSEIYFNLYPNMPGYSGQMKIDTVEISAQPVLPELTNSEGTMRLPLNTSLSPGETVDIRLDYHALIPTSPDLGYKIFSYIDNIAALAGFYPTIAVYDDEGWNVSIPPTFGDATYLDISFYNVQLTVPEQMVVATSGSLLNKISNGDGSQTLSLISGPMRDFYIVMSDKYETASEVVDGTVITSYYTPDNWADGQITLQYAANALRVFNNRFGQYPYAELDVAATPTTAGGVEYPGIVVISEQVYNQPGGFFQHTIAHEVAHQWWYGLVGNDQIDEPWLDESLTNYNTLIYWAEAVGLEQAKMIRNNYFIMPYEQAKEKGYDRAVAGSLNDFTEGEYGIFVYSKGPLFFDTLRQQVGIETYLKIMQTYYTKYKYKIAHPADLLQVIEQVSGQDVTPLFETWIEKNP